MANESSLVKKQPLVGIKLDRSKCFDRIVVPITVALGEKLGLDSKYLKTWAKLYNGFERYICWHSFISDSPLMASNGVAQGDTSSVLAINILMSAWAFVVQSFSCMLPCTLMIPTSTLKPKMLKSLLKPSQPLRHLTPWQDKSLISARAVFGQRLVVPKRNSKDSSPMFKWKTLLKS